MYDQGKGKKRRKRRANKNSSMSFKQLSFGVPQGGAPAGGLGQRGPLPTMAPPRHLPKVIVPPSDSLVIKRLPNGELIAMKTSDKEQNPPPAPVQQPSYSPKPVDQPPQPTWQPMAPPPKKPHDSLSTVWKPPLSAAPAPPPSKPNMSMPFSGTQVKPPSSPPPLPVKSPPSSERQFQPMQQFSPSDSSKRRRRKKKKKLNKFSTSVNQGGDSQTAVMPPPPRRDPPPVTPRKKSSTSRVPKKRSNVGGFVPKANPDLVGKANAAETENSFSRMNTQMEQMQLASPYKKPEKRGRKDQENTQTSFYGLATQEPSDLQFDAAMAKMKLKMERQKSNQNMNTLDDFTPTTSPTQGRQKSQQMQKRLKSQFGFFSNKFNHKDKSSRTQNEYVVRRRRNRA